MTQYAVFDAKGERTLAPPKEDKAEAILAFLETLLGRPVKRTDGSRKLWAQIAALGYRCAEIET